MSGVPENLMIDTTKSRMCYYSVENDINLLFDLAQMAAILDLPPFFKLRISNTFPLKLVI